jgi:hypothetical protein
MARKEKDMNKGLRALKKKLREKVVGHHINYEYNGLTHKQEAVIVPIYHMEHWIVSQLQRRGKYVSKGFLQTLKHFVWLRETTGNFVDLQLEDRNIIESVEQAQHPTNTEQICPI